jgi:hypothetical protein
MTRCRTPTIDSASRPRRLGLIYNSASGRHARHWPRRVLPSRVPAIEVKTAAEIGAAVADLAAEGVDLLAVAGGDGTVAAVLTQVMLGGHFQAPPILALVPTGSTNMTANDVGTVDVRRRGWQPLYDWAQRPVAVDQRVSERPVLRIEPNQHEPPFCGLFFGAGAVHHAVTYTQRDLHRVGLRGEMGPGLAFLRFIAAVATGDRRHFAPTHIHARDSHGHELDTQTLILLASTLDRLVLRFHPFWGTEAGPIAWTAVDNAARGLFRRLPGLARGRAGSAMHPANGYRSHNTDRLEIAFDGGFIVDGEFFTARRDAGPVVLSSAGHARFLRL